MKIVLIHKAVFYKRPPVISVLMILLNLGYEVVLITTDISSEWLERLKGKRCRVYKFETKFNATSSFTKILDYLDFRKYVYSILKDEYDSNTLLWVESAYTIVALGTKLNKFNFVLQIQELHEKSKMQLKAISKVINNAKIVFMPEFNRTIIYRVWFKLKKRPIVLPNKPYFIPSCSELEKFREKYVDLLELFNTNRVILYQGVIHPERDLSPFVLAVKELGDDYKLLLLGQDFGRVGYYKKLNNNIVHIDFLPAPDYLLFTSLCYIGIVTYDPLELNNVYCAPNKIYEYAAFGKPMIGNNIPGLKPIENYKAGRLVDDDNIDDIIKSVLAIEHNYDEYSRNSYNLYSSVDNLKVIKESLDGIELC